MAVQYDKLFNFVREYRSTKELYPFVHFLNKLWEAKQKVVVSAVDGQGQLYCRALTDIVNERGSESDEVFVMDVVCEALLQQVACSNVRWFLLEKCELMHHLARKFLATQSTTVQMRVGRTMQTFLIHSRIDEASCLISLELVAELLRALVTQIRASGRSYDFTETALGLLASLCQIWSGCAQVMHVIDDYQVLRKTLLRFLSAEMVKRTTIVYTMTIMFHLCNSDDRLFNKRNIRQTLQVLFNIMLNGENNWASLYAATLLTEICKSSRTSHLLAEYRSLPVSLRDTLAQLGSKEKIIVEKYLEFLLTVSILGPQYRHTVMEAVLNVPPSDGSAVDPSSSCSSASFIWDRAAALDACCSPSRLDPLAVIVSLIGHPETSICVCASRLLDDVYLELYSSSACAGGAKEGRLPRLGVLGDVVHEFLSDSAAELSAVAASSGGGWGTGSGVESQLRWRRCLALLGQVRHLMQLATNLLVTGDAWIDQASRIVPHTDRLLRHQLDSSPLLSAPGFLELYSRSTTTNEATDILLPLAGLGVEVFVDLLFFYYRATELRPDSGVFGERLKAQLEHANCPVMLAFALSAATNNQTTLQRALVLQGVCLHLQDFNVELMGEKMYQFSSEFSRLKSQERCQRQTGTVGITVDGGDGGDTTMLLTEAVEAAPGVTGFSGDVSYHNPVPIACNNQTVEVCASQHEMLPIQLTRPAGSELDMSCVAGVTQTEPPLSSRVEPPHAASTTDCSSHTLENKVQQVVKRWMEQPETTFTTAEVYSIFEHRIQSLQNQEVLMDEIISNKTAALHQSEALLNQYRNKLVAAEKDSKQLHTLQMAAEARLTEQGDQLRAHADKVTELEKVNQTLIETNRMNEKQRDDAFAMLKRLQERVAKFAEDKNSFEASISNLSSQLEESQRLLSYKDSQICNYSHVTKLINKLTGNKSPVEASSLEELRRSISTPVEPVTAAASQVDAEREAEEQSSNTNNSQQHSQSWQTPYRGVGDQPNSRKKDPSPQQPQQPQQQSNSSPTHASASSPSDGFPPRSSISSSDFLQLYKNNCRILQGATSHK